MRYIILLFLFITLSACGANIDVHKPIPHALVTDGEKGGYTLINVRPGETEASNSFINSLSNNLQQSLSELSLYPKKNASLKVYVKIIKYAIKGGTSRKVMGSLAGADEIKSTIQVIGVDTDKIVGESTIFTSSAMAYGQEAMAWVHADDIATFLSSATTEN